jgi:hypothetical protein
MVCSVSIRFSPTEHQTVTVTQRTIRKDAFGRDPDRPEFLAGVGRPLFALHQLNLPLCAISMRMAIRLEVRSIWSYIDIYDGSVIFSMDT